MPRQNDYLHLLLEVTQTITASLDPQEVFTLIVTKIPEVIQVDAATIRLLDPSRRHLILEAASSVTFVPGYGMAVAQAQHVVRELGELLG